MVKTGGIKEAQGSRDNNFHEESFQRRRKAKMFRSRLGLIKFLGEEKKKRGGDRGERGRVRQV